MPELPEAETIVRSLRPYVEGHRIVSAEFLSARVSKNKAAALAGRRVKSLGRHGKQLLFELDQGWMLVKLGMTGSLLWNAVATPYTRARLRLDNGVVLFDDVRQFGSIEVREAPPELGPDPLEIDASELAARLKRRERAIKPLLLDQKFLRGIGNIYADESLFRAGIHPKAKACRLKPERARGLHRAIQEVLREAIEHRGSSVSDYVDASGEKGDFQARHRVYQKQGEPCMNCGAEIRRIMLGQRGTHFCPNCQRR